MSNLAVGQLSEVVIYMTLREKTLALCATYHIRPDKKSGQCFLVDEEVLARIMREAGLQKTDTVLEVGGGLGVLTELLAAHAGKVVVVERDRRLVPILQKLSTQFSNLTVVEGDILRFSPVGDGLQQDAYTIVANIPYNITAMFLKRFTATLEAKPKAMVVMLQKEVAERITVPAGSLSILGVAVQYYMQVAYLFTVSRKNFYPEPNVDSAVVRLTRKQSLPLDSVQEKHMFQLVHIGFAARRKQLKNNLAAGLHIPVAEAEKFIAGIGRAETVRAQELSVADWVRLTQCVSHNL